jgi:hypothetical protein
VRRTFINQDVSCLKVKFIEVNPATQEVQALAI